MSQSTTDPAARPEERLANALPAHLAGRLLAPLREFGLVTVEDLYECVASVGGNWYRSLDGVSRQDAVALVDWLARRYAGAGEITPRFYPTEAAQAPLAGTAPAPEGPARSIRPLFRTDLSGRQGQNRGHDGILAAEDDLAAIEEWLRARAANPNTSAQYRKEAERFLLWCATERGLALSSLTVADAALYPRWLEGLGRTEPAAWAALWRLPQEAWIGPKNTPRLSPGWRPFNGPLGATSRRSALNVIRLLFNFLTRTGYLRHNPFDQVSARLRLLPGEGLPREYADRSLNEEQWREALSCLESWPRAEERARLRVILTLGKGLGLRASEMTHARAGWLVRRELGGQPTDILEVVGKGDKVRRLPLSPGQTGVIDEYLALRGLPPLASCPPETLLLAPLERRPDRPARPLSRSGLHRALHDFFDAAAAAAEARDPAGAAKLRAASTHWLRHTFAGTAVKAMDLNLVQAAMGHASIATTSRYLLPEEAALAQALKKLPSI